MAASNISYIRTGINFKTISTIPEIFKKHQITVTWDINAKYLSDVMSLYLLRAVLSPNEKVDLSSPVVQKKFRTVYKWERGKDSGDPATSFDDVFVWDNKKDNNLHNLNSENDANWTEKKFLSAIQKICAGEQGVVYKIYGYSRRMSRNATPMGFFCNGQYVIALSQKNQMINDRWWSEGGKVWTSQKAKRGYFVRVAVDMQRNLGEGTKKSRRVWASTTQGEVYCFDYWTGETIGSWSNNVDDTPIFALSYDPINNQCLCYDGLGNIVALKESVDGKIVENVKASFNDFKKTKTGAGRTMGGVCAVDRSGSRPVVYFYVIVNRENVIKFKVTSNDISDKFSTSI